MIDDLKELSDTPRKSLEENYNPIENISETTTSPLLDKRESRRSRRIVKAPNRFIFLGEAISDEHDLDLNNYNTTISNKNAKNWQNAIKVEDDVYMIESNGFIMKDQ